MLCVGSGYALVGVDLHKIPLWVLFYILCVIIHLRLLAGELLVAVGGYSGVSSNPAFLHCHLRKMRQWVNGRRNDCDRPCRCSAHFCFLLACRARCLACSFISGVQLSALERSFHRLTILEPSSSQNTITLFSSALISVILFLTDFALSLSMLNTSSVRATSVRLAQSAQAISSSLFNLNTSQMSLIRS